MHTYKLLLSLLIQPKLYKLVILLDHKFACFNIKVLFMFLYQNERYKDY